MGQVDCAERIHLLAQDLEPFFKQLLVDNLFDGINCLNHVHLFSVTGDIRVVFRENFQAFPIATTKRYLPGQTATCLFQTIDLILCPEVDIVLK